ncbi:type I-C CRISPR-associated protein Cas8c/Csd1 [Streptomyces sp. NPDC006186]|uniref:type I-C CRISPR-associated protein Cas8c/Csd1 n=1 Tax=Streptomyces sp. NPDC006186 TaxID=3155248 RepID=UPI0033ADE8A9
MLLRRLTEYAARVEAKGELPPPYYRSKRIQWILQLNEDGTEARLIDRRPAKNEQPRETPAPYMYRSGKKPPPLLMVDTAQYVLALPKQTEGQPATKSDAEEARRRRDTYADLLLAWADAAPDGPYAPTVRTFVTTGVLHRLKAPIEMKHTDNIALMAHDNTWLHLLPSAQEAWVAGVRSRKSAKNATGICLVCGTYGDLLDTIPESIKAGTIPTTGQARDAQLVSINATAQGRDGVLQLVNTPVCERCGRRAMAALNHLLASGTNRRRTPDSVTVWWTREPVDDLFATLYTPTDTTVARLLASLHERPDPATADRIDPNAYYALTLGINNARAVVLDWLDIPVARLRNHLGAWFEHHRVYDGWNDRYLYLPLWHLALAAGRWDAKAKKYVPDSAPKHLERELLHAALSRTPVPARLLPHLLQRIRADQHIDTPRIALLRLALHPNRRDHRVTAPADRLDLTQLDPGYLCGRVFAVLEAIQRAALPEVNATIGDRYFGTAMTAPATVLTSLRLGANAHLKRLRRDNTAAYTALNRRLAETFAAFDHRHGIPALLTTDQQAMFVLGYEQQRAADFAAIAEHKKKGQAASASSESPVPDAADETDESDETDEG